MGPEMDFKTTLTLLIEVFERENIRYALIGGFALGVLGVPRATVDLDFLIEKDDLEKIGRIMKSYSYDCVYQSENVSQFISPVKVFGEVDFLHAFRQISRKMLARAKEIAIFEGKGKIKVLLPEDIIGLKVQSVANNPERISKDYADIEALMDYHKKSLDWQVVEEYFSLFGLKDKFLELKAKYCYAE